MIRFFAVACAGLCIDIGLAWSLAVWGGVGLTLAAALGFIAGAVCNYLLHEFWTFRAASRSVSPRRMGLYALTTGATLLIRLTAVTALSRLFPAEGNVALILLLATGVSFAFNFAASKFIVFNRR
ncbi:GtrA family protein [Roseobacter fucihabitans]|uniref:GtrA family protein n=1 Tax=Roseobacter fucihabitans TaxID=1537242 RepID=UPI0016533C9C|nr:GtrA family protein [Roseobacter litoralis]